MRHAGGLFLATLILSGCGTDESARKMDLRSQALKTPALESGLSPPALTANDVRTMRPGWLQDVSICLPPLISMNTQVTPPGGGAPFTVESRLRELDVDVNESRALTDASGRVLYVGAPLEPGGVQHLKLEEVGPVLKKFYGGLILPEQVAAWESGGGKVFINLSSDSPPTLTPYEVQH